MRRRAKRDLTVLLGIVLVIGMGFFINYEFSRGEMIEFYTEMRTQLEEKRAARGADLLSWELVISTPWTRGGGPDFGQDLRDHDGELVDIIGFMTPIDRYRNMTEFILLPLPIECYFCQMPPREHVMLVTMADGAVTDRYKEPVLISGQLELREGGDARFFYRIGDATVAAAEEGGTLTRWRISPEHFTPEHMELKEDVELEEGFVID